MFIGNVDSQGNSSNPDFMVSKIGLGIYEIELQSSFMNHESFQTLGLGNSAAKVEDTSTKFRIEIQDQNGDLIDDDFEFEYGIDKSN